LAIYHFRTGTHSRAKGHSALAAAAYRSGQVLYDERTGETFDYRQYRATHGNAALSEIYLPADAPEEFQDRGFLWNSAEAAEKTKAGAYKNSAAICRDNVAALPHELTLEQNKKLVADFAKWRVERYGTAVDASIHAPDEKGSDKNWHVHFLETTRVLDEKGFGGKSELELSGKKKMELGLATGQEQVKEMRTAWANHVNAALKAAGHDVRVTEKSYRDLGIDKKPTIHEGPAATQMKRRGEQAERAAENAQIKSHNEAAAKINKLEAQARVIDFQLEKERRMNAAFGKLKDEIADKQQERERSAAKSQADRQQALQERAAAIAQGLRIDIKRSAKAKFEELRERHKQEWKGAKQASGQFDRETILATYQPEIDKHEAEKARLEGLSTSVLASLVYRLREGHSVKDAIEAERLSIQDAKNRRDGYLHSIEQLRERHKQERQALKEETQEHLGDAAEKGMAQARAEQEALLAEAQSSPEAAQRLAANAQAKTVQGKAKVAQVKRLAREQDNKQRAHESQKEQDDKQRQAQHDKADLHTQEQNVMAHEHRKKRDVSSLEEWESVARVQQARIDAARPRNPSSNQAVNQNEAVTYGEDGRAYTAEELEAEKQRVEAEASREAMHQEIDSGFEHSMDIDTDISHEY